MDPHDQKLREDWMKEVKNTGGLIPAYVADYWLKVIEGEREEVYRKAMVVMKEYLEKNATAISGDIIFAKLSKTDLERLTPSLKTE